MSPITSRSATYTGTPASSGRSMNGRNRFTRDGDNSTDRKTWPESSSRSIDTHPSDRKNSSPSNFRRAA